jgi:hypothetical protein
MNEEKKSVEQPATIRTDGEIGNGRAYMSTQTNPPRHHPGDPILEPRAEHRTRHPNEHELLARLAEGLREELPQHSTSPQAESAPEEPWIEEAERAPGLSPYELDRLEREIAEEQQRARRPLEPVRRPPPPPRLRPHKAARDSLPGLVLRLVAVAVVAALLGLVFVGKLSLAARWRESAIEPLKRVVALVIGRTEPSAGANGIPVADTPKLVAEGAEAGPHDEIGLGVRLKGAAEGALVFVSGLAAGTTLSTGRAWGETGWIIQAAEIDKTVLRPPHGFVGTMQYTLTLRLADGRSADRQVLQLQWDRTANGGGPGRESSASRQLSTEEIATLLKRGEELFKTGDLAGARLLLQRAAEAHDPVGALGLATTYDPNVLDELGVRGVAGDAATARLWYEKAKEYGSREAPRRLELLASQGR